MVTAHSSSSHRSHGDEPDQNPDPDPDPGAGAGAGAGVSQPHDSLARYALGRSQILAETIANALDPTITAALNLEQLTPISGSFVDKTLRATHADFLARVPYHHHPNHAAYVYIILEHQSTHDPTMAERMVKSIVGVWNHVTDNHPTPTKHLPLVIPIVLYHGERPWNHPTSIAERLDPHAHQTGLAHHGIHLNLIIDDLTHTSDHQLLARPGQLLTQYITILFARHREPRHALALLNQAATRTPGELSDADASVVFRYAVHITGHTNSKHTQELIKHYPALEATMTTYLEESHQFFRQEALTEGLEQGVEQGQRELLISLLHTKFGPLTPTQLTHINNANPQQLQTWALHTLTAATTDEVLETIG